MTQKFFWNNTCFFFLFDKARLDVNIWSTATRQSNKKIIRLEILLLFSKNRNRIEETGELQYESIADRL